jgi:dUTP pyrophosphatase
MQAPNVLKLKPIHPNFKQPKQATSGAAGFDLYMPEAGYIGPGEKVTVGLGFATAIPEGFVGFLMPRSGVGSEKTLELANTIGGMDDDYRGEWLATLRVKDGQAFSWEAGARILQFLVVPIPKITLEIVADLDETERGEGGYGSTGTT